MKYKYTERKGSLHGNIEVPLKKRVASRKQAHQADIIDAETHDELVEARVVIEEQSETIQELQKQLRQSQKQSKKLSIEKEKSEIYLQKAEKYKIIAKTFRNEVDELKKQVEKMNDNQTCNHESQDQQRNDQIAIIAQELVHTLQNLQNCTQQFSSSQQIEHPFTQLSLLIQALATIVLQNDNHQDHAGQIQYQKDRPEMSSYYNSDRLCQNGFGNDPCSQSQALHHSIFSPQFMASTSRAGQQTTQPNPNNDSSAIENFTLTWDQSNCNQGNNTNASIQNNQLEQQQHLDLLMKIQQEMSQLRDESQMVIGQNHRLKSHNSLLQSQLEQHQSLSQSGLIERQYTEVFEQLQKDNEKLQQRIEELESAKKSQSTSQRLQNQINEVRHQMMKFEYENLNLKEERETFVSKINSLENANANQDKIIKYIQANNQKPLQTVPTNQESLDLQQYADAKRNTNSQRISSKQLGINQNEFLNNDIKSHRPFILENRNDQRLATQANQRGSSDGSSHSLNYSKTKGGGTRNNKSQLNDMSIYMDTAAQEKSEVFYGDDKDNLFSLSSTQPENTMKHIMPNNNENFHPKHLDFNQVQNLTSQSLRENNYSAVFGLLKSEKVSKTQSQFPSTVLTNDIIKIDDINQTQRQDVRNKSFDRSTTNMSNTNPLCNVGATEVNPTQSQESLPEDRPLKEPSSSGNDFNKTQYQNLNYIESEQSFDRSRYSNYDSKNATQQMPKILSASNLANQSQETFKQVLSHQPSRDQLFSKATTNKNSSRKALTVGLNQNASQGFLTHNDFAKPKSPSFLSQDQDRENYNMENLLKKHFQVQKEKATDFRQLAFNNTGSLSQNTYSAVSTGNDELVQKGQNTISIRTLNLKKEISTLDQEIIMLQNNLKQALTRKDGAQK